LKSILFLVQHILIAPNVKGLENETAGPPPPEPVGYGNKIDKVYCLEIIFSLKIDFSSPWEDSFQSNRDSIKENLYIVHPNHRQVLELCNRTLSPRIMVDFKRIRCGNYQTLFL